MVQDNSKLSTEQRATKMCRAYFSEHILAPRGMRNGNFGAQFVVRGNLPET
eukprot:m.1047986 g.1047986  ORF g.1047986 m.1047986 type:complete len:51 (+) comp24172_c0_seq20:5331-5483(+)